MSGNLTIITETRGLSAYIWLNRPDRHNALDQNMAAEFLAVMQQHNNDPAVRVIIIQGKGPSFCAGADLLWMQQATSLTARENFLECLLLAKCFHAIAVSPKVTIALIHGAAYGGAGGFIAASDLAYATESCTFAFSEVRLGMIPATIAPYVVRRIGHTNAMELMLTGRKFSSREAESMGLINKSLPDEKLNDYTTTVVENILQGSPASQRGIKSGMHAWKYAFMKEDMVEQSARQMAEARIAADAREGFSAFLEKRKANWEPA